MKFNAKALLVAAALLAGTALAQNARTEPNAVARGEIMFAFGGAMKTLGGMAGGEMAFDGAAAQAAKDALVAAVAAAPEAFTTQGETDPASKAKPEIWANWDDFAAKVAAMSAGVDALDVTSAETIGAGMGAIGGACKDCHMAYRM